MAYEREADFAVGDVWGASWELRPDAVAPLVAPSPGPTAIGNITQGLLHKGWAARPDLETGKVYLRESDGAEWKEEVELFSFSGTPAEMLSLAFDAAGLPVVAMERGGEILVRYWDGASYTLVNLGEGASPALIHRAPDTPFSEVILFFERAGGIRFRVASGDWAVEYDTEYSLAANQRLWRAILGQENRLHLILSTRDVATGEYSLQRISEPEAYGPGCLKATGYSDRIDDGADTYIVWRGDGTLETDCIIEVDALIIGAGGDAGAASGNADPSILWCDEDGLGLDPDTDIPPAVHKADGGGHGAYIDLDGQTGGSGGGGGGQSPSGNSMWTAGGARIAPQGNRGGGGQSTWGLLPKKIATSGGGGALGGPGSGGLCLQGAPTTAGKGGLPLKLPGWYVYSPRGGNGSALAVKDPTPATGPVTGGGGAGGVRLVSALVIPAGQVIPIEVGSGSAGGGPGQGGDGGPSIVGGGITGMISLRIRRVYLDDLEPAVLSGGTESDWAGYRYHKFTASGTLTITETGKAEILAVGGGGGGGGNCGGGGGGGDVRKVETWFRSASEPVTIGDGGVGGEFAGDNGEDTSVGDHVVAEGGGGGGGTAGGNSRATGGGAGSGNNSPGEGKALRGYHGGKGGGYDLSAGGSARHAGGGGGAGESGEQGATRETMGDELDDNWEVPVTGSLNIAARSFLLLESGGTHHALINKNVAVDEMFVQGLTEPAHSNLHCGITARAYHPTGDPDEVPVGYFAYTNHNNQQFTGGTSATTYLHDLGTQHHIQAYVKDSLQQYAIYGPNGPATPRAYSVVRRNQTDATYNGTFRSFGFRGQGSPITGTNKQGRCYGLLCCRSKYLIIGSAPAGGSAQVLNEAGAVVASATESAGEIQVDLSLFGNGTTGCTEVVPLEGFAEIRVYDSGAALVASWGSGNVYPGGEYDVIGSDLVIREDPGDSATEPAPITGLLAATDFSELTPGPEHGDGGDGIEVEAGWTTTGVGDADDYLGGGGGAGAELSIAGEGGKGGGGAGAIGAAAPTAGEANTGGGGGGSGDGAVDGAAGGSGIIVIRTVIRQPSGAELAALGMLFNHDAHELSGSLEHGEVVDFWNDESGLDNHLKKAGSPTFDDGAVTDGINGHPAVRTGLNNYFEHLAAIVNGMTEGEVMAVLKADTDPASDQGMWYFSPSNFSSHHPWSDGKVYEDWGRATRVDAGNPVPSLAVPHLYHVISKANEFTINLNGVQLYQTLTNTPSFLTTAPLVGKSKAAYYFKGIWGQLVGWNRILSAGERTAGNAYLNWRWSLGL